MYLQSGGCRPQHRQASWRHWISIPYTTENKKWISIDVYRRTWKVRSIEVRKSNICQIYRKSSLVKCETATILTTAFFITYMQLCSNNYSSLSKQKFNLTYHVSYSEILWTPISMGILNLMQSLAYTWKAQNSRKTDVSTSWN